jgi:hypothetical protein
LNSAPWRVPLFSAWAAMGEQQRKQTAEHHYNLAQHDTLFQQIRREQLK